MAGRCQFYSSGAGYLHDVYQTEVRAELALSLTHGLSLGPRPCPRPAVLPQRASAASSPRVW